MIISRQLLFPLEDRSVRFLYVPGSEREKEAISRSFRSIFAWPCYACHYTRLCLGLCWSLSWMQAVSSCRASWDQWKRTGRSAVALWRSPSLHRKRVLYIAQRRTVSIEMFAFELFAVFGVLVRSSAGFGCVGRYFSAFDRWLVGLT